MTRGSSSRSGRVPERSDQRRRRNRADIDTASNSTTKRGPNPPRDMKGLARKWYESLRTSGQSVYYTDSDWISALVIARGIDSFEEKRSGQMLTAILSGFATLAATEGDRRRLRLELDRGSDRDEDEDAAVTALDDYRRMASSE